MPRGSSTNTPQIQPGAIRLLNFEKTALRAAELMAHMKSFFLPYSMPKEFPGEAKWFGEALGTGNFAAKNAGIQDTVFSNETYAARELMSTEYHLSEQWDPKERNESFIALKNADPGKVKEIMSKRMATIDGICWDAVCGAVRRRTQKAGTTGRTEPSDVTNHFVPASNVIVVKAMDDLVDSGSNDYGKFSKVLQFIRKAIIKSVKTTNVADYKFCFPVNEVIDDAFSAEKRFNNVDWSTHMNKGYGNETYVTRDFVFKRGGTGWLKTVNDLPRTVKDYYVKTADTLAVTSATAGNGLAKLSSAYPNHVVIPIWAREAVGTRNGKGLKTYAYTQFQKLQAPGVTYMFDFGAVRLHEDRVFLLCVPAS